MKPKRRDWNLGRWLVFAIVCIVLAVGALAFAGDKVKTKKETKSDTSPQSIQTWVSEGGIGFGWLSDGHDGVMQVDFHLFSAINDKMSLNFMTAHNPSMPGENLYTGLSGTYAVVQAEGYTASLVVGYKGLNILDGTWAGERGFVYGFKVTLPLR